MGLPSLRHPVKYMHKPKFAQDSLTTFCKTPKFAFKVIAGFCNRKTCVAFISNMVPKTVGMTMLEKVLQIKVTFSLIMYWSCFLIKIYSALFHLMTTSSLAHLSQASAHREVQWEGVGGRQNTRKGDHCSSCLSVIFYTIFTNIWSKKHAVSDNKTSKFFEECIYLCCLLP